ncbi:MAG: hypothetical protein ULS35scaffold63_51 [Phage 33_17]|nr:MAG: hypothetical protein ULS35scaffold63_51 [Phage 33_17]
MTILILLSAIIGILIYKLMQAYNRINTLEQMVNYHLRELAAAKEPDNYNYPTIYYMSEKKKYVKLIK